ncbi:hypothetical protein CORC01_02585 [Colletotrichum orchidophilum]|uniref:Uncharacterized protein n=1 Tax=Colletotrichum orchidophilum TaxID=1209926 RepID=A0A1G4BL15_9PEZI|nr:uncharacterized protein CORC01_02585 [Colletotrichum orchidophilum]OHF02006.1 hypothetical protein CORC01_02585 [Colletotrichum orchidophilum]
MVASDPRLFSICAIITFLSPFPVSLPPTRWNGCAASRKSTFICLDSHDLNAPRPSFQFTLPCLRMEDQGCHHSWMSPSPASAPSGR